MHGLRKELDKIEHAIVVFVQTVLSCRLISIRGWKAGFVFMNKESDVIERLVLSCIRVE